jgi:hypothetical protein
MSRVTFTPIPVGISEGKARIAIFVTPKLDGPSLETFADWPRVVGSLSFEVSLAKFSAGRLSGADGFVDPASIKHYFTTGPSQDTTSKLNSAWYGKLFAGCTVESFAGQALPAGTTFKSYDTQATRDCLRSFGKAFFKIPPQPHPHQMAFRIEKDHVEPRAVSSVNAINGAWSLVMMHATVPPAAADVNSLAAPPIAPASTADTIRKRDRLRISQKPFNDADVAVSAQRQADPMAHRAADRQARTNGGVRPVPQNPLFAVRSFWQRLQRKATTVPKDLVKETQQRNYDFHQRWALLGHHPQLFPMLGMRIEISIPLETTQPAALKLADFDALSVKVNGLPVGGNVNSDNPPWVAYENSSFWPAPLWNGSITQGYVNVLDSEHHIETEDLDHVAQSYQQYSETISELYPTPEAFTQSIGSFSESGYPPTRKTAGIALMRQYRDADFHQAVDRASRATSGGNPNWVWFADDLTRGFVLDLEEQDGDGVHPAQWFSMCARHEKLSLDGEVLFDGLTESSLKPPAIQDNTRAEGSAPVQELYVSEALARWEGEYVCTNAPSANSIAGSTPAGGPKTFPAFRAVISEPPQPPPVRSIGSRYRVRARLEFLTGDRPAGPIPINNFLQGPSSPNPPTLGSDPTSPAKQLVLRRYEPLGIPDAVLTAAIGDDSKNRAARRNILVTTQDDRDTGTSWRLLTPPRVTSALADMMIKRNQAEDLVRGFRRLALNKKDGSLTDVAARYADKPRVPFVPDPLATELVVQVIDRITGATLNEPVRAPLYVDKRVNWPDALVHFLNVMKSSTGDGFNLTLSNDHPLKSFASITDDSALIELRLEPGYHVTLEIISGFGLDGISRLQQMELWALEGSAETQADILKYGHPLLTPPMRIEVIHAVQHPLTAPVPMAGQLSNSTALNTTRTLAKYEIVRNAGAKLWNSTVTFQIDRKSTGKLHVTAEYPEYRKSIQFVPPITAKHPAGDIDVPTDEQANYEQPSSIDVPLSIDPGDAGFRRLVLRTTATSRFVGQLSLTASECLTEGTSESIDLRNVKPPDSVELAYMVPSFGWETASQDEEGGFWSRRKGAGLRLYFTGSWPTSGTDELVGIVLKQTDALVALLKDFKKRDFTKKDSSKPQSISMPIPANIPPGPSLQREYDHLSGWGLDPKFPAQTQSDTTLSLTDWDFPQGTALEAKEPLGACGWGIGLRDFPDVNPVVVVGYKVNYDKVTSMWYADVAFDRAPRYGTYVRLALSRYQPVSAPGNEISSVVMSDFSKLSADRTLTVSRCKVQIPASGNERERHVDGLAVSIWGIPGPGTAAGQNIFAVTLERRHMEDSNSLAWEATHGPFEGAAVSPRDYKPPLPQLDTNEKLLWYGEVSRDSCVDRMLVVREYEQWPDRTGSPAKLLFYADAWEL